MISVDRFLLKQPIRETHHKYHMIDVIVIVFFCFARSWIFREEKVGKMGNGTRTDSSGQLWTQEPHKKRRCIIDLKSLSSMASASLHIDS